MKKQDSNHGYEHDPCWSTSLLVTNLEKTHFIVLPNRRKIDVHGERWTLPYFEKTIDELTPVQSVAWLASVQLQLKLGENQFNLRHTGSDDYFFNIYLYENNISTPCIEALFSNALDSGWYQTMPFSRAGLLHSGLDEEQKKLLSEAGLITYVPKKISSSNFLKVAFSTKDLDLKMRGYSPKPL